jgi:hypothetical protein
MPTIPASSPTLGDPAEREAQVLTKATVRAAEALGIRAAVLARILGVSEATVSRMKRGGYSLRRGTKEFELSQLFVRLYRSLAAITGGDDASARSWLAGGNRALGRPPIELIQTVAGLTDAVRYVDSRRAPL